MLARFRLAALRRLGLCIGIEAFDGLRAEVFVHSAGLAELVHHREPGGGRRGGSVSFSYRRALISLSDQVDDT